MKPFKCFRSFSVSLLETLEYEIWKGNIFSQCLTVVKLFIHQLLMTSTVLGRMLSILCFSVKVLSWNFQIGNFTGGFPSLFWLVRKFTRKHQKSKSDSELRNGLLNKYWWTLNSHGPATGTIVSMIPIISTSTRSSGSDNSGPDTSREVLFSHLSVFNTPCYNTNRQIVLHNHETNCTLQTINADIEICRLL